MSEFEPFTMLIDLIKDQQEEIKRLNKEINTLMDYRNEEYNSFGSQYATQGPVGPMGPKGSDFSDELKRAGFIGDPQQFFMCIRNGWVGPMHKHWWGTEEDNE